MKLPTQSGLSIFSLSLKPFIEMTPMELVKLSSFFPHIYCKISEQQRNPRASRSHVALNHRSKSPCLGPGFSSSMETLFLFGLVVCHRSLSRLQRGSSRSAAAAGAVGKTLALFFSASCLKAEALLMEVTHAEIKSRSRRCDLILLTLLSVFTVVERLASFVAAALPLAPSSP